ncbi:MAG: glycosyltransferase [Anaerolineae bacterium]|nr:glycosyltransferase [Anaerolineae bacterium]MDW8071435.1 glycosyltransferase [Anaerolineae bacterium]
MHILLLTPQLPYPPHQGTSLRNYNLIAQLAKRHQVEVLSFLDEGQSLTAAAPLLTICSRVEAVPVPKRTPIRRIGQLVGSRLPDMAWRLWSPHYYARLVRRLAEVRFDVVQIEAIELAPYLPAIEAARPRPLIVFDEHNCEWRLQQRAFFTDVCTPWRWPAALYSLIQWRRLRRYEGEICRRVDQVVAVSEMDRQGILSVAPEVSITVVPNGVDLEEYEGYRGTKECFDLVFTGKMDFRPNVDAMLWFCDQVLPLIRRQCPWVRLAIVGQRPHPRLERLRRVDGVTLTGWVPDVRPYLAGATVYVAPLRVGGGTRLKLAQAMAMGCAIVATSLAAEGFPVESGKHLILADTPHQFAAAVVQLLADPGLRNRLGAEARALVRSRYGWEQLVLQLEEVYQSAATNVREVSI